MEQDPLFVSAVPESISKNSDTTRTKNLTALVILLLGLFTGSLFVDFVQLAMGRGFSAKAVKGNNLIETEGKVWVAHTEPKVTVHIVTDQNCAQCDPKEALVWLRRIVPTLEAVAMEASSESGRSIIERFNIATLPAFVFSGAITRTAFYSQAQSLFREDGGRYFFDMGKIGLPVGKYLTLPVVTERSIAFGPPDAKVTVVEYSDFQCPYCQAYHTTVSRIIKEYGDRIRFVYKHLPLTSIHPQAHNAALAAECAHEQGKFQIYANQLFERQSEWGKNVGTQTFKNYAWALRLNGQTFSRCLDDKKYEDRIVADTKEAAAYFIAGTPGTFINDTFLAGAVSYDELKAAIDRELAE